MAGVETITLVAFAAGVGNLIYDGRRFCGMIQDGRDIPIAARKIVANAEDVIKFAQSIDDGRQHNANRLPFHNANMLPFLEACIYNSKELIGIANNLIAHSTLYNSPQGFYKKIHSMLIWRKGEEKIRQHLATIDCFRASWIECSSQLDLSISDGPQVSDLMLKVSTTNRVRNSTKPNPML